MKKLLTPILICLIIFFSACGSEWLDERSDKSLVVPTTLADLQAMLDNTPYMTGNHQGGVLPEMGQNGSDDYFLTDNVWNSINIVYKNAYVWASDIYEGNSSFDWNTPYRTVFYANTVLSHLDEIVPENYQLNEYASIKGSTLFYRANAFFHLAQIFSKPYSISAHTDLGIPLRLDPDFNIPTRRSTIFETYERILNDLDEALTLLPELPVYKTRPSKAAVFGLKSRIYLVMQDYENALVNAEECLNLQGDLLDFNSIDVNANLPFPRFGIEVIFDSSLIYGLAMDNHIVSPDLYDLYEVNDLRRNAYFREIFGERKFKGSYIRSQSVLFGGIATDEVILIKSECHARLGQIQPAMLSLNMLLENRYVKDNGISTYNPIEVNSQTEALDLILIERRKELPFRGLRWMDLRRLNLEGRGITLSRVVNGTEYVLEPNSSRYTYPIPDNVILATGIEQNVR